MSDDRGAMDLYVETAPFPQTIECPKCDAEMRFLIESTDIGGTRCEECGVDIDYVHDRQGGTAVDETEQDTLVTDGGNDRDDAGLLHVDLFAGRGGWQAATKPDPSWKVVGIDIRPMAGADVVGDVAHLPIDAKPDLLTMSPPCTEFARWMLPWLDEPNPDMSLVEAALDAVEDLEPRFWVMENSRGLHQYWKPARTHVGPFYLWGEFPLLDVDASDIKGKMQTSGESPDRRAEIPRVLSKAMKQAVETFGTSIDPKTNALANQ